jgi:hypothetical protein
MEDELRGDAGFREEERKGIGGREDAGIGGGEEANDWGCGFTDLGFHPLSPRIWKKKTKEGYANEQAPLPPTSGPACTLTHLSWTHPENQEVKTELTGSNGCSEKWR